MTKAKMKVTIAAEGKGEYLVGHVGRDAATVFFMSSSGNAVHVVAHFDDRAEAAHAAFGLALAAGCNFTGEI